MQELFKGTIRGFGGSWYSGLGQIVIEDSETKGTESIPCDNACTVRALEDAFGDTITEGHMATGQWIYE